MALEEGDKLWMLRYPFMKTIKMRLYAESALIIAYWMRGNLEYAELEL